MKKVLFTAVAVLGFTFANAQEEGTTSYKPVEGTITTEVGLTGGLNNANFDLNTGVLKFRYFLKDDMALRIGMGVNSSKEEMIDSTDPLNLVTTTDKNSNFGLNLGIEKHFAGSDRLSTYAGADLLIGFRGANSEQSSNGFVATSDGANYDGLNFSNNAGTDFGFRLFTGADYYIAKKVYLGVEGGLSFMTGKDKDIVLSSTGSPNFTVLGGKSGGLSTSVTGGVRIGFQF